MLPLSEGVVVDVDDVAAASGTRDLKGLAMQVGRAVAPAAVAKTKNQRMPSCTGF